METIKELPHVTVKDGDTVFYSDNGAKIIHADGTFDMVSVENLSLDDKVDAHYRFGKDEPIGSSKRAMYEEKKSSFIKGYNTRDAETIELYNRQCVRADNLQEENNRLKEELKDAFKTAKIDAYRFLIGRIDPETDLLLQRFIEALEKH